MNESVKKFFEAHKIIHYLCKPLIFLCKKLIWVYKLIIFIRDLIVKIKNMFCLPFYVIGRENAFLAWIFIVIIFAPMASYLPFVDGFAESTYTQFFQTYTNVYALTLCLSLLAPLVAEIGLNLFVNYKIVKDAQFVGFFVFHVTLSFVFISVITIVFCKKIDADYSFNLKVSYIAIAYSYLLYCISKMYSFPELLKYGTKTYIEEEKDRCDIKKKKAEETKEISVGGKKVVI